MLELLLGEGMGIGRLGKVCQEPGQVLPKAGFSHGMTCSWGGDVSLH